MRANDFAGVSTPLRWEELDSADVHPEEFTLLDSADVHPEEFTLTSVERRFTREGDLWRPMSVGPRLDLREALERMGRLVG